MKYSYFLHLFLVFLFCVSALPQDKGLPKLTPDEILSKHLASLGTPAALSAVKSRIFVGKAHLSSKVGFIGQLDGPVQFASVGENVLLAAMFNSNEYPYEKVAYNGKDLTIGKPSGRTTSLGEFLRSNKIIVKSGFFGGSLSSSWPFLGPTKGFKVESGGTSNVGGRNLYKLKVTGNMGNLRIVLFFEADTFRHVATEYSYVIEPQINRAARSGNENGDNNMATTQGAANARSTYVTLTERFSNFAKSNDLVIPLVYVIDYTYQDDFKTLSQTWSMKFENAYFDQDLAIDVFKVS